MAFIPTTTNLNTLFEFVSLKHTITYEGSAIPPALPITYDVVVTTAQPNSTITVAGDIISGYFSDSFENQIHYRTIQDTFVTVPKWEQINTSELYGIYHYEADPRTSIIYNYLATAENSETQNYTITVKNNWSSGRNQLLKYANPEVYQSILGIWVNNAGDVTPWLTNSGEEITWESSAWQ